MMYNNIFNKLLFIIINVVTYETSGARKIDRRYTPGERVN